MKMKMLDFRGIFQREWLPELFLNDENIGLYFDAVNEDKVDELIVYIWNEMIKAYNKNPENYPLEFAVNTYNYDDNTYFSVIEMPELPKSKGTNLAIYAMIIFDNENRKRPRFFLGETDYNSFLRHIFVAEWIREDEQYRHQNWGPLLVDDDIMSPVSKENELNEFIGTVVSVYLSE